MSHENVIETRSFGAITENVCEFYLDELLTDDPAGLPAEPNVLYELYLEDKAKQLIDIPVLIRNYRVSEEDTKEPNRSEDKADWKMARRFLILDTITGVEGEGMQPAFVRWASDVKLKV